MAVLAVAAAGAWAGSALITGTVLGMTGASIGWLAGSMLGNAMFAETQKSAGPRLGDLQVSGSAYGTPIPYVAGHPRIAGQIIWASAKREIPTTQRSGGKGGGGGSKHTTYTYEVDLLILLTDNVISDVTRVWRNGGLVFDGVASSATWSRMTVYGGAADQLPDPDYEAAVGTANAPAYRGRGSVFIKSLQLGGTGQMPNLTFEVSHGLPPVVLAWTYRTVNTSACVIWTGSIFCSVGSGGSYASATSQDGITWTLGTMLVGNWYSVAWNGSIFCAVGSNYRSATSVDGLNWTSRSAVGNYMFDIVWAMGLFCAVGRDISGTSPDGITWTRGYIPEGEWKSIVWTGLSLVAVGTDVCATSQDGIHWVERAIPNGEWYSVSWNGSVLCAVGSSKCATSTDGSVWELRSIPTGIWSDITWSGSAFFAIGSAGLAFSADGVDWTIDSSLETGITTWASVVSNGSVICATSGSRKFGLSSDPSAGSSAADEPLKSVVNAVLSRTNIAPGKYDTFALGNITRPVRAMAIGTVSSARTVLEMLAAAYHFDCVLSDKLYFRPRASAPVATLTFDEVGVVVDSSSNADPLPLIMASELEIPAQLAVTFSNVDGDYQNDTQYSDRLLTGQESTSATSLPLGFSASEGKQIADALLLDKAVSALSTTVGVGITRAALEPTDVVLLTDDDGSRYRMRISKKTDAAGMITLGCVADDATVFTQAGVTAGGTTSQTTVAALATTTFALLDIPLLRDVDDLPGFYLAVMGDAANWSNCAIYSSLDDLTYTQVTDMADQTAIGTCSTPLGNWSGGNVFDEASTVTVNVGAIQQLSSVTRDDILTNTATNAALIGNELVQYRTATLISGGVYTLSGFLRGRRGTEWAQAGHASGERFVLLGNSGLRYIALQSGDLGRARYYKAASAGQKLSDVIAIAITPTGVPLETLSPVNARANRATADTVLTWTRRTRLSTRLVGTLPINSPLGETTEAYEVEVWDATYTTLKRTLATSTPSATYTSAQQVADFGGAQAVLRLKIYQLSSTVARGYPLTVSI